MIKIEKIYPRDIIAFFVLIFSLVLISKGINAIVSGIVIMIVTFYFSKRLYEERNPNGNIDERVRKIEGRFGRLDFKSPPKIDNPTENPSQSPVFYHGKLSS